MDSFFSLAFVVAAGGAVPSAVVAAIVAVPSAALLMALLLFLQLLPLWFFMLWLLWLPLFLLATKMKYFVRLISSTSSPVFETSTSPSLSLLPSTEKSPCSSAPTHTRGRTSTEVTQKLFIRKSSLKNDIIPPIIPVLWNAWMLPNEIYLDEDFLTYEMTETLLNAVEIDQARIPPPQKKYY